MNSLRVERRGTARGCAGCARAPRPTRAARRPLPCRPATRRGSTRRSSAPRAAAARRSRPRSTASRAWRSTSGWRTAVSSETRAPPEPPTMTAGAMSSARSRPGELVGLHLRLRRARRSTRRTRRSSGRSQISTRWPCAAKRLRRARGCPGASLLKRPPGVIDPRRAVVADDLVGDRRPVDRRPSACARDCTRVVPTAHAARGETASRDRRRAPARRPLDRRAGRTHGSSTRTGDVFDPATGAVTKQVAFASADDVDAAVAAASAAFATWRSTSLDRAHEGAVPLPRAAAAARRRARRDHHGRARQGAERRAAARSRAGSRSSSSRAACRSC